MTDGTLWTSENLEYDDEIHSLKSEKSYINILDPDGDETMPITQPFRQSNLLKLNNIIGKAIQVPTTKKPMLTNNPTI